MLIYTLSDNKKLHVIDADCTDLIKEWNTNPKHQTARSIFMQPLINKNNTLVPVCATTLSYAYLRILTM